LDLPILDDASVVLTTSLKLTSPSPTFAVESVAVQLDLEYFTRGNLQITLTSPQGTSSVLSPGKRPETTQLATTDRWKLLTVRNWGEKPDGNWTLSIVDLQAGDAGTCASEPWSMTIGLQVLDCNLIDSIGLCVGGVLDPNTKLTPLLFQQIFGYQDVNGRKATDACCPCGGGLSTAEVRQLLKQWTLVVYGYDKQSVTGRTMTLSPSPAPSVLEIMEDPLSPPTTSPTHRPTRRNSKVPVSTPTATPTMPPTMQRTFRNPSKAPTPETNTGSLPPAVS
jgi:subtilisin-like proprotein convertase family protein